ncbi:MAG: hypothetical protein WBE26_19190 [Phycisphaerae bacterium]
MGNLRSETVKAAICLLVPASWQLSVLFWPGERLIQLINNDDTFLYLAVAHNWAHHGFPSFDRIHTTNGFQLPWQMVLTAVAWFTSDRMLLARLALMLCAVLNFAAGVVLFRAVRRIAGRSSAWISLATWGCYLLAMQPAMIGMENALHGFVGAYVVCAWCRLYTAGAVRPHLLWATSLLLGLNAAVRLDSGMISLCVFLHILWLARVRGWRTGPVLANLILPGIALGAVYALVNIYIAGTVTPISGSAKMVYAARYFEGVPQIEVVKESVWRCVLPWVRSLSSVVSARPWLDALSDLIGRTPARLLVALTVLALLVLTGMVTCVRIIRHRDSCWPIVAILGAANTLHVVLMVVVLRQFSCARWYYSFLVLFWCMLFGCAFGAVLNGPMKHIGAVFTARHVKVAVVGLLTLTFTVDIYKFCLRPVDENLHILRWQTGRWLGQSDLPAEARIGAWNAGALNYFSGRHVISLDGLMNDRHFLDRLRTGRPILDYLHEEGVEYILDYNARDATMPRKYDWDEEETFRALWPWSDVQLIRTFEMPDIRTIYLIKIPS